MRAPEKRLCCKPRKLLRFLRARLLLPPQPVPYNPYNSGSPALGSNLGIRESWSGEPQYHFLFKCVWPRPRWGESAVKERRQRPRYEPGQIVPNTGIYRIYHNRHRLMHEATLIEANRFPKCKRCNEAVRFVLLRSIHSKDALPFRSTDLLEEWERRSIKPS